MGLRAQVHDERLSLRFEVRPLIAMALGADAQWLAVNIADPSPLILDVPVRIRRRGQELRLVFGASDRAAPASGDGKLIELMVKAHGARDALLTNDVPIAPAEMPHLTRLARLTYFAPDIVAAIVDGRQPADLSARSLLRVRRLPVCWKEQREVLGFAY
jgi:site-specific DNA recombinase